MLFKIIIIVFLIGFIYRALAKFILPLFHITRSASDHVRRMQEQMNNMKNGNQNQGPDPYNINNTKSQKKRHIDEDYIDYEEVK